MSPKEYYSTYQADNQFSLLSKITLSEIIKFTPSHVLEFGCGTGKNLAPLDKAGIPTIGLDISMMNVINAKTKNDLPCVMCCDESYLRNLANIDVIFTISVLDHIENIDGIIGEFIRIANKAVILSETNDVPADYYYPHDYESYGFEKQSFRWKSEADKAEYGIWILKK